MSTTDDFQTPPASISENMVSTAADCHGCGSCASAADDDSDLENVTLSAPACTPGEACESCQ